MAYTVKKVDEYGVFTISKNINLLSDAINLAKLAINIVSE